MQEYVQYKDNPMYDAEKRLNMAYLLLTNPHMIEVIQKSGGHFLHGTNANALPSILKYGINSVNRSRENNIDVTTGEESFRFNRKIGFVSLTDCLDVALRYASILPRECSRTNTLLNFGVLIGTSLEDMKDINVSSIDSGISEVGVGGNLPINHIKFLAVPNDKVEFVKKMAEQTNIEVIPMDMQDTYFIKTFREKLELLENGKENATPTEVSYPTYSKEDVKPLVKSRRVSKIKEIFEALKAKIFMSIKQTDDKSISERG